eukprot:CAMPEP_0177652686 /NCGR_PEP_ID=MMETSP0447-20121125/13274_1 /TAXON_ID=0 /ORGANISM="Stygamoeba regulata, Strain BSH-02190019" /LENGTH=90 /DNA_ID=CAMNT_0019155971 /DNA_START=106 /DNA_END=378 /DNA_ORIENTATION=-
MSEQGDDQKGAPEGAAEETPEVLAERALLNKYGVLPKKTNLAKKKMSCGKKAHFDSADWAMKKQGAADTSGAKPASGNSPLAGKKDLPKA